MGKRHAGLKFMPGKFVFPGGRIEAGDRSMPVTGALHPRAEQALMARVTRPSAQRGRALALAAIRETFEETGLLLGTKDYGAPGHASRPARPGRPFRSAACFRISRPCSSSPAPSRRRSASRRFDTRFFAVDRTAIADEVEGIVGPEAELVELAWVTIAQAKALDLPPDHHGDPGRAGGPDRGGLRATSSRSRSSISSVAVSCGSCCDESVIPDEAQRRSGIV